MEVMVLRGGPADVGAHQTRWAYPRLFQEASRKPQGSENLCSLRSCQDVRSGGEDGQAGEVIIRVEVLPPPAPPLH